MHTEIGERSELRAAKMLRLPRSPPTNVAKICVKRFLQTSNNGDSSNSAAVSVGPPSTSAPTTIRTEAEFDERIEIDPFTQKGPYPPVKTRPLTVPTNLKLADVRPVYAKLPDYKDGFALVKGKNGEMIANNSLYLASMKKAQCAKTITYDEMTWGVERTIFMAHMKAVKRRQMTYKDPYTGYEVFTVAQLLLNRKCCGNACRHCPYNHENVPDEKRTLKAWNGAFYV